jgi:predicted XRE-type DNA-binding protein
MTQEPIFEESSGNVFADLGLEDADELFTRGKIGIQVIRILKQRNLKQREISQILGIPTARRTSFNERRVSTLHIKSGHIGII